MRHGELISFLDSDDISIRDRIFWSVEEFKKDKSIGMVCGNYQIVLNRTKLLKPFYKKAPNITWDTLIRQNLVASGSVTVKKKLIEEVGGFDERFWIAEDYDLWLKCVENYRAKFIFKVLYYYSIINKDGSSLTKRKDIQKDHLKNLDIIKSESKQRVKLTNDKSNKSKNSN